MSGLFSWPPGGSATSAQSAAGGTVRGSWRSGRRTRPGAEAGVGGGGRWEVAWERGSFEAGQSRSWEHLSWAGLTCEALG